jgi:uncharacterized membrane protein
MSQETQVAQEPQEPQVHPHVLAVERILAKVLRIGSIIAGAMLAVGIVAMLVTGAAWSVWLITAGLITLLATPVMRVLVAAIVFVKERDWLYALFCLVVPCALAIGVKLGMVG